MISFQNRLHIGDCSLVGLKAGYIGIFIHAGIHYTLYFPYVRWLFWHDQIRFLIEHSLLWSKVNNIWSDHISFIWTVWLEETKWKNIARVWTFFQIMVCTSQHKIIMFWNFFAWYVTGSPESYRGNNANTVYSIYAISTVILKENLSYCATDLRNFLSFSWSGTEGLHLRFSRKKPH